MEGGGVRARRCWKHRAMHKIWTWALVHLFVKVYTCKQKSNVSVYPQLPPPLMPQFPKRKTKHSQMKKDNPSEESEFRTSGDTVRFNMSCSIGDWKQL